MTSARPLFTRMRFIYNPRSGYNARYPFLLEEARRFVASHARDAEIQLTERPRHATELARRAVQEGCDVVVAIGGDGMLNEVATALIGTSTALGLIPCGSGNGLGRHLGIPARSAAAFLPLREGRIRLIDTAEVNGLPFVNVMGVGFDAEISSRFNTLTRRGLPGYLHTTLRTWTQHRSFRCTIRHAGGELATEAFLVAAANSDQYGNDCYIAPGATVDDGLLDLTVLQRVDWVTAGPLAARLFSKTLDGSAHVTRLQGTEFVIEREQSGPIHTDGEVHEAAARLEVRVRPRSLHVVVP